jgi:hypothetical protein
MQTEEVIETAIRSARELHIIKCGARDPRKCGCSFKFAELRELKLSLYATELKTRRVIARELEKARKEMINDNEVKSDNVFFIDSIYKIFIDVVDAGGLL